MSSPLAQHQLGALHHQPPVMATGIAHQQLFDQLRMVELKDVAAEAAVMIYVTVAVSGGDHEVEGILTKQFAGAQAAEEAWSWWVGLVGYVPDVRGNGGWRGHKTSLAQDGIGAASRDETIWVVSVEVRAFALSFRAL